MSQQFEDMLHSLCYAYVDSIRSDSDNQNAYNEAYAKLVERDRKLLEALKELGEDVRGHTTFTEDC